MGQKLFDYFYNKYGFRGNMFLIPPDDLEKITDIDILKEYIESMKLEIFMTENRIKKLSSNSEPKGSTHNSD